MHAEWMGCRYWDLIRRITGSGYEPMVQSTMIGLVFWLVCCWMYRRKIFIRI